MQNFTQSMSKEMMDDLKVWAKIRRCNNVQELLRNVIVPDWLEMQKVKKN